LVLSHIGCEFGMRPGSHVLPGASRENAAANSDYSIIPHGAGGSNQ
jgi:hypothetical protein